MATKKNNPDEIINQENTKKVDKNRKLAIDAFNHWTSVNVLYQTDDGTCFFSANAADDHAKKIGGSIIKLVRNEIIKQNGAE